MSQDRTGLKRRDFIAASAGTAAAVAAAAMADGSNTLIDPGAKPAMAGPPRHDRVAFLCAVRGALARGGSVC
ncbi:MAG TPA: hypothetical protein VMU01_09070 [Rhizomicrobium sp.]|nr:hypothetical protein [Rhizomicrobium sp.]